MNGKAFFVFGIFAALFMAGILFAPVSAKTSQYFDCLIIKPSIYENGTPICWKNPSPQFQGVINAEAYKLGYNVQPDGTYARGMD